MKNHSKRSQDEAVPILLEDGSPILTDDDGQILLQFGIRPEDCDQRDAGRESPGNPF